MEETKKNLHALKHKLSETVIADTNKQMTMEEILGAIPPKTVFDSAGRKIEKPDTLDNSHIEQEGIHSFQHAPDEEPFFQAKKFHL